LTLDNLTLIIIVFFVFILAAYSIVSNDFDDDVSAVFDVDIVDYGVVTVENDPVWTLDKTDYYNKTIVDGLVFNSSLWNVLGDNIYYNDGNVGIGTSSPNRALTVRSTDSQIAKFESINPGGDAFVHVGSNSAGDAGFIMAEDGDDKYIFYMDYSQQESFRIYSYADATSILKYNPTVSSLYLGGNVGIRTSSPTALLHLAAGTATNPPIKLTDGTALTTGEAGSIEYYDDRIYITNVASQKAIDRTSDVLLETITVANTTTETTIFTAPIPAKCFKSR